MKIYPFKPIAFSFIVLTALMVSATGYAEYGARGDRRSSREIANGFWREHSAGADDDPDTYKISQTLYGGSDDDSTDKPVGVLSDGGAVKNLQSG